MAFGPFQGNIVLQTLYVTSKKTIGSQVRTFLGPVFMP